MRFLNTDNLLALFFLVLALACLMCSFTTIQRPSADQVWGDEICVETECHPGKVIAVVRELEEGTQELIIKRNRKSLIIPVKVRMYYRQRHYFHFEDDRGFMSVGPFDKNVFIFLDGEHISIHIKKSTFTYNKK
jgi:hypothetical protein